MTLVKTSDPNIPDESRVKFSEWNDQNPAIHQNPDDPASKPCLFTIG